MLVKVLYFGMLKDLLGRDRTTLELAAGETVGGLVRVLQKSASKHSDMGQNDVWKSLAVAVNQEYAAADHVLGEGDEVALLPPVSGGAGEAAAV